MSEVDISKLVDRFLAWPLPKTVRPDLCVMYLDKWPHQAFGTSLLTADEARQMFEYVLSESAQQKVSSP